MMLIIIVYDTADHASSIIFIFKHIFGCRPESIQQTQGDMDYSSISIGPNLDMLSVILKANIIPL